MSLNINNIIKFYRDAYQFEYNTEKLFNFFSKKISHRYFPKTFEVLKQKNYHLPVSTDWGEKIYSELELGSSEKKIVCGTFFIKGKAEVLGKPQKIFAPLYLFDVKLEQVNEVFVITIEHDSLSLNPIAANYLNSLNQKVNHHYDDLTDVLLQYDNPFSFDGLVFLNDYLKTQFKDLDSSLIDKRIEHEERISDLEAIYKSREQNYENTIFPDLAIGLMDKPKKSKGIINELTELCAIKHWQNSILHSVFGRASDGEMKKNHKGQYLGPVVPVSLSKNQEKILASAFNSKLTIVIGPPGTGKSFTVAALAVQAAHEGKKVLIASKSEQACQVINNKIRKDIGINGIALDASRPRYKISVAAKLKNIANGIGVKELSVERFKKLQNDVQTLRANINKSIKALSDRTTIEIKWGKKLSNDSNDILSQLQKGWIKYRHYGKEPIWKLQFLIRKSELQLKKKEKRFIKAAYQNQLFKLLRNNRFELLKLEEAFLERRGNVIKKIFSSVNYEVVLKAFPIWICQSSNIANILPLEKELFDLVIIDEASQCDIASSIPLLYRSKAAVIVGDPNQLRHISFISRRQEENTKLKYGLNKADIKFKNRSILDQVNKVLPDQDNLIFLDEHYRSMPDIIDFSNKEFYSSQLKVMTLNPGTEELRNIHIIETDGVRNSKGENHEEAQAIIESISSVIRKETSLDKASSSTIGIISPFRAQVNLLKNLVKGQIDIKAIRKHQILIGTPFSFQGEERDQVFLSFTVDADTHNMALRYLERSDVFNVSITRAKTSQNVYISIDNKQLKEESLLRKYLVNEVEWNQKVESNAAYDQFLLEVIKFLENEAKGTIYIDRLVSGARLDIVIVQKNRILGIDLVGFPGEFEDQLTVESIKSLERANIDTFILPFSTWHLNFNLCKRALFKFIEK